MNIVKYIAIAVISYLLGNIASGLLVARAFGVEDIRNVYGMLEKDPEKYVL